MYANEFNYKEMMYMIWVRDTKRSALQVSTARDM